MSAVDSQSAIGERGARRVAVKICGLTRPQDATHAEGVGASYLGAILVGSAVSAAGDGAAAVRALSTIARVSR